MSLGYETAGTVTLSTGRDGIVLRLAGEVDAGVVQCFERRWYDMTTPLDAIDAAAVTFIGSVGACLIVRCVQASARSGRSAVLRRSSPAVDRVLRLTGLEPLVPRASSAAAPGVTPVRRECPALPVLTGRRSRAVPAAATCCLEPLTELLSSSAAG